MHPAFEKYTFTRIREGTKHLDEDRYEKIPLEILIKLSNNITMTTEQDHTDGRALVNKIIEFRKKISELLNTIGSKGFLPSREMSLAKTDCQRSFHHLGLQLKSMNEKNPYPESTNPDSKIVEPIADAVYSEIPLHGTTQLERVKDLRGHVQQIIDEYDNEGYPLSYELRHFKKSQDWLTEVKMWLGWELGRIRDQRDVDNAPQTPSVESERMPLY